MLCARPHHALILVLATSACVDPNKEDGGDDVGDVEQLPDHDAELRCAAADTPPMTSPPMTSMGPIVGGVTIGPCGHVVYRDGVGQGWLVSPDGERSELDHENHRIEFSPTGDMLAWQGEINGGLTVRDLLSGSEREIQESGTADNFGFVPSFADSERGAWLWSCEQGVLERHDLSGGEVVAESVDCMSVIGSTGSPRLAYGDVEGRVWRANLDSGEVVGSEDLDFVAHDGSKRDDTLWIDHDGELVVHVAIEWQGDPDADSEWPIELWARVIDSEGAIEIDSPSSLAVRQSPRRGAPVFVFHDGDIVRYDAGDPSSIDMTWDSSELAASGELFFTTLDSEVFVSEASSASEPLSVGAFDTPVELQPSRNGGTLAVEHHSDICIVDDLGECDRILLFLRAWSRELGIAPIELLSTSPWNLEAAFDDGSLLVVGAPVQAVGPMYDGEQPAPRALLLDREGTTLAELPAGNGDLAIRQTFPLADDRVLFEYQPESGVGELILAQTGVGFTTLVAGVDVALLQSWVDARGQRVAFVTELNGAGTLWYGGL